MQSTPQSLSLDRVSTIFQTWRNSKSHKFERTPNSLKILVKQLLPLYSKSQITQSLGIGTRLLTSILSADSDLKQKSRSAKYKSPRKKLQPAKMIGAPLNSTSTSRNNNIHGIPKNNDHSNHSSNSNVNNQEEVNFIPFTITIDDMPPNSINNKNNRQIDTNATTPILTLTTSATSTTSITPTPTTSTNVEHPQCEILKPNGIRLIIHAHSTSSLDLTSIISTFLCSN